VTQMFTQAGGPEAATTHEAGPTLNRVLVRYSFVEIVIELETCHIYKMLL
jgi:hypothetical protein